ncbi:hypothetical protein ZIOFF_039930 [Zingiber officinale]|uniref:Uncharacterized protein n=1 Tax=Zingiber officinale TaxID=94328 RepID=A0A8J5G5J8_ZINOF|nr:hypothetical protein ZIOFF_039930 [Zingiber officinale]
MELKVLVDFDSSLTESSVENSIVANCVEMDADFVGYTKSYADMAAAAGMHADYAEMNSERVEKVTGNSDLKALMEGILVLTLEVVARHFFMQLTEGLKLLRLLRRNPVERLSFEESFNHNFLATLKTIDTPSESKNSLDDGADDVGPSLLSDVSN